MAQHLGVQCGLTNEVHDRREALERVMQQHILVTDHRVHVGGAGQSPRQTGRERRVLEVRPLDQII